MIDKLRWWGYRIVFMRWWTGCDGDGFVEKGIAVFACEKRGCH